jgi:hypothetical protein
MSSADEKTRKWQQPVVDESAAPPQTISFYCPNGHRIKVEARLAGKSGPCSKCGVVVTIPAVGSPPKRPPGGVKVGQTATAATQSSEEKPSLDFLGTATAPEPETSPQPAEPPSDEPADAVAELPQIVVTPPEETAEEPENPPVFGDGAAGDFFAPPPADAPWHPTADLVARLWAEREHGGVFEVHHTGGVFVPQWFEFTWSRGTHGLFASQAADGTITLTAVAWDSIQKIIVRQVEGLPDGMFE